MQKRLIAIGIILICLGLIFTGCAKKESKISFWHIGTADTDKAYYQGVVDEFVKANPSAKIEVTILENEAFKTKLATVMQSGTPPDIFHSWGGGVLAEYAKAGLLRDISKFTKGTDYGKSMAAGVWGVYAADGKQYGAPHDMGAVTFWYNKEILAKVGYDAFPTDYADLLTLIGKLKAKGITPIALGGGDKWPAMHMWSYIALRLGGAQLFKGVLDGSNSAGFSDPTFVKAAQMMADLAKMGAFQKGFLGASYPDEGALMGNGEAAMELMGQWAPNVEKDSSKSKLGIGDKLAAAAFPAIAGGAGAVTEVIGGGNGMAVGKNASDMAVKFLMFLDNKENNAKYATAAGIIPTVVGAEVGIKDPNAKLVKAIVDQCTYYQLYLDQLLPPAAGGAVNDAVQTMVAGTATPEQACAAIQAAYLASK
jgi:raffinose/stachyose/melibiose transport system substrate-binding protein